MRAPENRVADRYAAGAFVYCRRIAAAFQHRRRNYGLELPEIPEEDVFRYVSDGDEISVGDLKFEVLGTPGHSVGGLCFLERQARKLFCGDTIFAGAIGRTDHPGGDYDLLMKGIWEKLMCLDGDIEAVPGHGPTTDISTERMTNPFLLPFNEPYEE